ncbi:Fusaric acid resistance protein-like-domain-containing protein [Blakeslea trispora]|nr:Fusaric acid resistance protein-like-domain-containing protein [Blakeslea trispora]
MTFSASYHVFDPEVIWAFLRPIALAGAIALAVDYLVWPDDSINNFSSVTHKVLAGYNVFFQEQSLGFLSNALEKKSSSLPSLKTRLQNGLLLMVDSKRAVKRDLIYSRISDVDCSHICKLITSMQPSLHGIGLSLILKDDYFHTENKNIYFKNFNNDIVVDAFTTSLNNIRSVCAELTDICFNATNQLSIRLSQLHYHPRTTLNSILWPFPRLWVSKPKDNDMQRMDIWVSSEQLRQTIQLLVEFSRNEKQFSKFVDMNDSEIPRNGPLYLLFLYIYNLNQHATKIADLLQFIEDTEKRRTKPKFWLPHQTLKKWLTSNTEVEASVGGNEGDFASQHDGNDLIRVSTRPEGSNRNNENSIIFEAKQGQKKNKKQRLNDPDVSEPVTLFHKIFNVLYSIELWAMDMTTIFTFKTALGVVLMAIPAWRPQDAGWYQNWRGQWAMITLVLWMFPMTGAFIFGIVDRLLGSMIGAVLGIIVWEISRGNPYGLAVICFVVFLPLYHVFFFVQRYRVMALMSKVTMLLIVSYEFNYVAEQVPNHDQIYTVAGKRLLLVVIGIIASGILIAIPFLPTSRVALRKHLSATVSDIGKCYGILSTSVLHPAGQNPTPEMEKSFRKLALELRRQVREEYSLFHHTAFEPSFRGYYPSESYQRLVEKMDNMSDLVINMGFCLRQVKPDWAKSIRSILLNERKDYVSSIITCLKLISSTLATKASLPPYLTHPIESRQKVINLLEKKIMISGKDIANPSFPSYSACLMNSLVFVDELEAALNVTERLVGVEDPEEWLLSRA